MATNKATSILAKGLGIKLQPRDDAVKDPVTRGESVFSINTADTFIEEEPTSAEWIREQVPSVRDVFDYFKSLFPFLQWITRYNSTWLIGDLVAGITVGAVVVPQGMAYAVLADLSPQFGLYSSFMGVLIYWFFATSKDITIGPVAVLSTVTGNVIIEASKKLPDVSKDQIASTLAIICGSIVCFLGLARLGWIVEFIPLTAITAYMTGSALNIAVGQVPTMMGITGFSTRDPTYLVFIHILKHLGRTTLDAAIGLTALFLLYAIRIACSQAGKRLPKWRRTIFFVNTLRTVFVILLYTLISWLVNRHHRKKPKFKILGTVPRGFQDARVPEVSPRVIKSFLNQLPATVIVMLIEHIAISKSFGRVNNYTINPSQELVAIGVTNLLGPLLGAYPATGSFSRTAIKSKAGVRTPLAGFITAIVVLLAIYALPAVFYYIPSAGLSAVIIHAVGDLITPPNTIYRFWRVSPIEVLIFFAGVIVTVFSSIENGIYVTICVSAALLLFRVVKARGRFVGKVQVHSVIGDHLLENSKGLEDSPAPDIPNIHPEQEQDDLGLSTRNIFLPIDHGDGSNPEIEVSAPYPGIFIYRFSEGYNYPNASHYTDYLVATIFKHTRRTDPELLGKLGDRPWNDPGPRRGKEHLVPDRPTLKAIILDLSSVNNVDVTSIQNLIDVRNQLDRYAAPDKVEWHFAHINNRWTKRALVSAGFGYLPPEEATFHRWKPIFSVAEIGGSDSAAAVAERRDTEKELRRKSVRDVEAGGPDAISRADAASSSSGSDELKKELTQTKPYADRTGRKIAVVHGLNMPLFHIDLTSAVQSAISNVERRFGREIAQPTGIDQVVDS